MSTDYYSLLTRYVGYHVSLTLHGQTNIAGKVVAVCYDGVYIEQAKLRSDLDSSAGFDLHSQDDTTPCQALIHVNQILALTSTDPKVPSVTIEEPRVVPQKPKLLAEPLEICVGSELLTAIERDAGEEGFGPQLVTLRNQIATELGLLLPDVILREETRVPLQSFVVKIRGVSTIESHVESHRLLALETLDSKKGLEGLRVEQTNFGFSGYWIERPQRELAEHLGYQVLDAGGMLLTHLDEIFRQRAAELFGRQQLEELLDQVRMISPALVDEVVPQLIRPRKLQKLLRNLLREGIPVRDFETILETLSDAAHETKDLYELTERTRQALNWSIMESLSLNGTLFTITLETSLESSLARTIQKSPRGPQLILNLQQREALLAGLDEQLNELRRLCYSEVILTTSRLRGPLRALIATRFPRCTVLSHDEIDAITEVETLGMVFHSDEFELDSRRLATVEPPRESSRTDSARTDTTRTEPRTRRSSTNQ